MHKSTLLSSGATEGDPCPVSALHTILNTALHDAFPSLSTVARRYLVFVATTYPGLLLPFPSTLPIHDKRRWRFYPTRYPSSCSGFASNCFGFLSTSTLPSPLSPPCLGEHVRRLGIIVLSLDRLVPILTHLASSGYLQHCLLPPSPPTPRHASHCKGASSGLGTSDTETKSSISTDTHSPSDHIAPLCSSFLSFTEALRTTARQVLKATLTAVSPSTRDPHDPSPSSPASSSASIDTTLSPNELDFLHNLATDTGLIPDLLLSP